MKTSSLQISTFLIIACSYNVRGEGFLKHDPKATHRSGVDHDAAFQKAMASVMGCVAKGESHSQQRLAQIERALSPMWRVLPKNGQGRVEWKMLRYLTHRFFVQQSSLLIRGLEPVRQVNDSQTGAAEILKKHAPSLVETVLEGRRVGSGFSFEDAVALVGTVEQLIFDSETTLLEKVYQIYRKPVQQTLTQGQLLHLMEGYVMIWFLGDDPDVIETLKANRTELAMDIPHWNSISEMIRGVITGMQFSRQQHPKPGYGPLLMSQAFSFDDAHQVVGILTKTFASYWESECQAIKSSLEKMDHTGTGRVKLSEFYGANSDGEWRFGESEAYLRELGALDESSAWNGKQVIIPNYIQGASNCIVTSEHYFVCCLNECESVLNEVETAVGSPLVAPEEIISILSNITTFDDERPKLTKLLKSQLEKIAETYAGKVPLHGRLFAQWLHYVFPRECPFPHKTGSTTTLSPKDYGDRLYATQDEVQTHASTRDKTMTEASVLEEAQLMSQWSEDEELIVDYSAHLRASWENSYTAFIGLFASSMLVLWFKLSSGSKPANQINGAFQSHTKAHFV